MDFKFNIKYFKSSNLPMIIAGILVGVGLILFFAVEYIGFYIGIGMVVFAGVILSFSMGGRTNEAELDEQTQRHIKNIQETAMKKLDIEEKHVKIMPPQLFSEYGYDADGLLLKKGKDGKIRTSWYSALIMLFGKDKLYLYSDSFSLIDDARKEAAKAYLYTDVDSCYLTDEEFEYPTKKEPMKIKYNIFNMKFNDGSIWQVPAHNDAEMDRIIDTLTRHVAKIKAEAEKAEKAE